MTKVSTNQLAIGKYAIFFLNRDFKIYLCGPILPCVKTVWEEARPNTILIRTNEAGKGPAQYPV